MQIRISEKVLQNYSQIKLLMDTSIPEYLVLHTSPTGILPLHSGDIVESAILRAKYGEGLLAYKLLKEICVDLTAASK